MNSKKKVQRTVFLGLIIVTGVIKRLISENNRLNHRTYKQEMVLITYERWMTAIQKGQYIAELLYKNGCREVAIYGLGRLGRQLYEEIYLSPIKITYVVDKNYSISNLEYQGVKCYHPEDQLPEVELIIITVPGEADKIISKMRKRVTCSIKSIDDILFLLD